jgi:hypothetical protein
MGLSLFQPLFILIEQSLRLFGFFSWYQQLIGGKAFLVSDLQLAGNMVPFQMIAKGIGYTGSSVGLVNNSHTLSK